MVWDKIPVEKHKEEVKHAQVDWRISPLMEPCRACTDRESQQQDHGTQPAHNERAVMMSLFSRLFNPEVGGAGEVCIPLTWVMILMGAESSQES
jgi:hypothetical protein